MASFYHTRSNSFPSRPHPLTSEVDEHLNRLRASQSTFTSASSISRNIYGLQDLHACVDKLFQLSLIQQALAQDHQKKWADELLNGSLSLLDICGITKNALLQTKESVQELQSIFRRRRGDDMGLTNEVKKYLSSRKTVKKTIQKALRNLKGNTSSSSISEEHETKATISILREVEAVTFSVIQSFLFLISGPRSPSKPSSWSLLSKLMLPQKVACEEEETYINEFEKVDAELSTLIGHKKSKSDKIQNQLKELESKIQDLEDGLEYLTRRLIKTRVSLLNILNH